ncbi:TIGR03943 family putative permease subunit [Streptomyces ovatisporus]|uniref:TIGR03943 family putative permease subunit n=1 Tax=Streptomyces ovatisporus TaxID=1128682 RepID=A0ABV9ABN8_9ACTN
MKREAQAVVLLLIGAAVVRAGSTDLYLRYVKAGLRPLLLTAGIVLIVVAIATVWYELRRPRTPQGNQPEPEHQDPDSPRGHTHREPRISWLLLLPLFALVLVAPPAPGSYSAMHAGTALQHPGDFPALPASDPLRLGVTDYAGRAAYGHGRSLEDRRIKITGFVALDRGGDPYLTRMVRSCCAADAQPVKIGLSGKMPPAMPADSWLEVTGTYTRKRMKDPVNGGAIPFFKVSQARSVPAPRDPYEN